MSENAPACPLPECASEFTYVLDGFHVCSKCAHEWPEGTDGTGPADGNDGESGSTAVIRDSVGNELADGDTVTVVKNLRLKGGSGQIKVGTKVRNIRLVNGVGDHDIDCKVDGFGPMQLKSSVVKKV